MRLRLALLALTVSAAAPAPAQPSLTPEQRQLNITSFEMVWQTVRDKHWDPKLGGLDWQAVHDELRPKVESAATMEDARAAMTEMLERLKQTHFNIVPAEAYRELKTTGEGDKPESQEGDPGIDVRVIDGHALVTALEPDSPAAAAGVKLGWEILRIDGKDVAAGLRKIRDGLSGQATLLDLMQTHAVRGRMTGDVGKSVELQFLDDKDRKVTMKLDRGRPRGKLTTLGNLPPLHFWVESRKVQPDVGYVRFNMFFEPDALIGAFQAMVKDCKDCSGFVIDLRGNPGGIGGLSMGVAGWFTEEKGQRLGTMYLRGASIKFALFPRPEPFRGPLVILVDGCSASTSEIFAGGLKDLKRAHIIGTRTAGAALPSVFTKLPNGDGFQYAIANYISEGGQPLEGIGLTPDEVVKLTRHQLLKGQDPALDAAVRWIRKQKE